MISNVSGPQVGRLCRRFLAASLLGALACGSAGAQGFSGADQPEAGQSRPLAHPEAAALADALTRYRRIEAAGGWPVIPRGPALSPGTRDPRIVTLRRRLAATGDLPLAPTQADDTYDEPLTAALRRFQTRHGLTADGLAGTRTLAALNRPVQDLIAQLELNLARWLSRHPDTQAPHVLVNIPEYRLRFYRDGQPALESRVVVGSRRHPTPELSEPMQQLVIHPFWHVPRRIGNEELLPKVQANPDYLYSEGLELVGLPEHLTPDALAWQAFTPESFPYRFRQKPGRENALGTMKFLFPNPHQVYLHDTPARSLFRRDMRAASHGCIRVDAPEQLAAALLALDGTDGAARVRALLERGRTRYLTLAQPVAVHLLYLTAAARPDGVYFFPDVYGRDRRSAHLLTAEIERVRQLPLTGRRPALVMAAPPVLPAF